MLLLAFLFTVSVYGDCGDLKTVGTFKKCTGIGLFLSGPDKTSFNRENPGGNPVPWVSNNYDFCKAQCEYVGMPGCCEYQNDHDYCYFYHAESTKSDRSQYKYKPPHSTKVITYASRHASMCTYDSSEYVMLPYNRKTGCEWNGVDKEGRSEKSNSVTLAQCEAFCLQKPECMFMTLSANGHCRTYKTCNYHNVNGGASTMKQKAVKGSTAASISAGSASACANDDSKSPTGSCDSFYQMYKSAGMDMCDADATFKKNCCATCSKASAGLEEAVGTKICKQDGKDSGVCDERKYLPASDACDNCKRGRRWVGWGGFGNHWCCTEADARNNDDCSCWHVRYHAEVDAAVETSEETEVGDASMQFAVQKEAVKTTDVAVYGLAFIGFGVVVFGAYKHYTGGKTHGDHVQTL
jgi:hypothetical protein